MKNQDCLALAMWSGPRNISTAMMRAWENRSDCEVWDEPLYAAYLHETGLNHPMRQQILEHDENDWKKVIDRCVGPCRHKIFYQKHMTHHFLPQFSKNWLLKLRHCFLLRDPGPVLKSYAVKRHEVTLTDIGLPQQVELFEWIGKHHEHVPMIIDSADFLQKPKAYLEAICHDIGIEFQDQMLSWPPGPRPSDGVWAEHWYNNVWKSTSFHAPRSQHVELDAKLDVILREAQPLYDHLHQLRLKL